MKIQAKSPCRVDLAGGTLDIWPLYLFHENAVTVNFAVDRYTSCELRPAMTRRSCSVPPTRKAKRHSTASRRLLSAKKYKLPLLAHIVRFFRPKTGIELSTNSEAPAGAGISGSSSLLITIGSALNKLTGAGYNIEKIREIAQNVEAQIIHVPTGCQDYYPAMYGGVSAIDLTAAGIMHNTFPVDLEDFNRRIVLAYSGKPRNSGINNWEVTKAHIDGDKAVFKNFERIAAIAHRSAAAHGQARLGRSRPPDPRGMVASPQERAGDHDRIHRPSDRERRRRAGGKAAKVCGAGGGGCVFFLVEPGSKEARPAGDRGRRGRECWT